MMSEKNQNNILKEYGIVEDPRVKQCLKEAMATFFLTIGHMLYVFACVYFLWEKAKNPSTVFGLPAYLFWGVFVGALVLIGCIWLLAKYYFKDMSLD